MKTHVFRRLSALMAGFAVALVGSLSAMPQAQAASSVEIPVTYTLIASSDETDFLESISYGRESYSAPFGFTNPSDVKLYEGKKVAYGRDAVNGELVLQSSIRLPDVSAATPGDYKWVMGSPESYVSPDLFYLSFEEVRFTVSATLSSDHEWENVKVTKEPSATHSHMEPEESTEINLSQRPRI